MPISPASLPQKAPIFLMHRAFEKPAWGNNHPLAISRHRAMMQLCQILNLVHKTNLHTYPLVQTKHLYQFHDPAYIRAFARADQSGKISQKEREATGLGSMENPLFPGLFERALAGVSGSVYAAKMAMHGRIVFHPAGGTHHGRPDRASGFCYFNDPVFAILALFDAGAKRVAYVDIDAHHGDGVEDAFANDPRVLTCSIHEENRWPYSGTAHQPGKHIYNYPVAKGINDTEYAHILEAAILAHISQFAPDAMVIVCGADALDGDPLSTMALSNQALIHATTKLSALAPATIVLGGGGYNPWTTARLWCALWARLSGQSLPRYLPDDAQQILRELQCDLIDKEETQPNWITQLLDPPNNGPIRSEIRTLTQ